MKIVVIGAGVAGLACAVELAERGAEVNVLEQSDVLGAAACSWHAGGMLAPWCERENAEPLVTQLGEESVAWWARRCPGTVQKGTLVVAHARDAAAMMEFARRTACFEHLDGRQLQALEPDLADRFSQALFFASEAHLDPRAALAALAERFAGLGGRICYGTHATREQVARLQRNGWTVVNCTGLAARESLTDLRGVKGEMILLRAKGVSLTRPVRILHARTPVYVVPRDNGIFMVGATMIESDEPTRTSVRSLLELLTVAYTLNPAFGEAEVVEIGAGVRPACFDNLPRIRRIDGVLHVNGLFRHGFLLAPALARMTAEVLLQDRHFPEVMDEDRGERRRA